MARLINADALPKYTGYALSADEVAKAVENAPTVDAEPVRHGHWEDEPSKYGKGFYKCSVCGEAWSYWWATVVPIDRMNKEMKYCPRCGAKMDGERREDDRTD